MKEFKGTPGPWLYTGRNNYVYSQERNIAVCDTFPNSFYAPNNSEEIIANANLIAATIELLNVVQKVSECDQFIELPCDLQFEIKDVITKALGE